MSQPTESTTQDPTAPRTFRRRSTVVTGFVISGVLLVLTVGLFPQNLGHGIWSVLAEPVVGLTLILIILLLNVWPHVIVKDPYVAVHNSLTWFEVPYDSIREMRTIRMGLIIRTHAGKTVPLTGYGTGSGKRMFDHKGSAALVTSAIREKMDALPDDDSDARAVRHWETRNVIALATMLALSVVITIAAVRTYH
jgi:hypothetical protein